MRHNANDNLKAAYKKLCCCNDHLNLAFQNSDDPNNKSEIRSALRVVGDALHSANHTMNNYED